MAGAIRSRRIGGRKPLNRSRSGDGLARPRRGGPKRRASCVAVVLVFLVLVILVVVATVQHQVQGDSASIRKRQLEDFYQAHNSDEQQPEPDEYQYDGGKYRSGDDDEIKDPRDNGEEAARQERLAREAAELEEARRQQEREEQTRREKDEELEQLREEKERLERQLREEEAERQKAERAAREAARLKEEEERRKMEEEARMKKLEEEREQERLDLLKKEEQRFQEEEARRREREEKREQEEEARRQKQIQQEQEQERLKTEQQTRQALQKEKHHAQQAVHLQNPEQPQNDDPKVPEHPDQPTISFCDFMRHKPSPAAMNAGGGTGFSNPAVLVLGMEDTSTDLVWHVISQILYPGRKAAQRTHDLQTKATAVEYDKLHKVGSDYQTEFWTKVSDKSKGKWLAHVFCQQQENEVAAGFPWLTSPDKITDNHKAQDTLELIKQLPKGSLKILRIKRNTLDVRIRHAQREQGAGVHEPIALDHKKIFPQLRKIQAEQDKVDKYLETHNIPHITLDFETLFPFDHWTNLVQGVQSFQASPTHINVDWRQLDTQLEATWRDVLRYLDVYKPLSMFDILHDAMQTHEVNTFWLQKDAVDKFAYIERALMGTHHQALVRKLR